MAEVNKTSSLHNKPLNDVLDSMVADLTTLRSALNAVVTKLNADAGVTDTDYASAGALTTTAD